MQREKKPYAILILDLDDFKKINDTAGHLTGDKMLCNLAHACQSVCRETDHLCRYGGDEFLILLQHISQNALQTKAEEICTAVKLPVTEHISLSIGGTYAHMSDTSLDAVISRADDALLQAKSNGKDNTCIK